MNVEKEDMQELANEIRINHFGNKITASKNYFIPIFKQCRNHCLYCGFSRNTRGTFVNKTDYLRHLQRAKLFGCHEILIVTGDRPESVNPAIRSFLEDNHFRTFIDYIYWACEQAINIGLKPHINLGVLTKEEWEFLQPVVASAGLMLESTSKRLLARGFAHQFSPDKDPEKRIKSIKDALDVGIPFTSGLLIGIGETSTERKDTLNELKKIADEFRLLQEIIVQGFSPLPNTPWRSRPRTPSSILLETISLARITLPSDVSIQFPPNLCDFPILDGIYAGANDLGGISPATIDYVNFTHPWPMWEELQKILSEDGLELIERGPVYGRALL